LHRSASVNLPNLITVIRIILTPLFVILLINDMMAEAVLVFAVAAITDGLDGLTARLLRQKTTLGSYLDPLADKLLLSSGYVCLAILKLLPSWLAVIVISRDVIILIGAIILHLLVGRFPVRPLLVSKITTTFQIAALLGAMGRVEWTGVAAWKWLPELYVATAAFTVISGLRYMWIGVGILTASEEERGRTGRQP